METVLRELGVSDMRIPKKMRALAASSMGLLQAYESACATVSYTHLTLPTNREV